MTDNKFDPLRDYLKAQKLDELVLSYDEIEDILGFGLPRAAQRAEWWFDDTPEHPRLQRIAVRDAGYDAKRLPDGDKVRFTRASASRRHRRPP
jgi:hypothetical protein